MGCHFQLSLSREPDTAGDRGGEFTFRVRRDGDAWQPQRVEVDETLPGGMFLFTNASIEDIRKFCVKGPVNLLEEAHMVQVGWGLLQLPDLQRELLGMDDIDRLSFNGHELPSQPWKPLLTQALAAASALAQQQAIEAQTPPAPSHAPRKRF